MFIDVTDLRGLIIKIPSNMIDNSWLKITEELQCTFLIDDESEINNLREIVDPKTEFRILSAGTFGLVPDIKRSILSMGLNPFEVAFVTTQVREIDLVYLERMGTILLNPKYYDFDTIGGKMPDFHVSNMDCLWNVVRGADKGYYGEVRTTQIGRGPVWFGNNGYILVTSLEYDKVQMPVIAAGRYFGTSHPRRATHQLSIRITDSKRRDRQDELFSRILTGTIDFIHNNILPVDGVTRVPPRPSSDRDRLKPWVQSICSQLNLLDLSSSLECIEDYPSQKSFSRDERLDNIRGKFKASNSVRGKHIVLIDDVLTTGATALECSKMLLDQGANQVTIAVLAINQFRFSGTANILDEFIKCDQCGEHLILKLTKENSAFYGCTRWSPANSTHGSMSYVIGRNKILANHTLNNDDLDEDDLIF